MKQGLYVFGDLFKEERLLVIRDRILPKSLVFESRSPFSGYFSDIPNQDLPLYMYLVVAQPYSLVEIERAMQHIKQEENLTFQGAKANVSIHGKKYVAIRLRHFAGYHQLIPIQEAFERQGIKMSSHGVKHEEEDALVEIVKFFCLDQVDEGIFLDCSEANHAYVEIPSSLNWEEFKEVTKRVRYNWDELPFDAAIGSFRLNNRFVEMVRIYGKTLDLGYLKSALKVYLRQTQADK